MEQNGDLASALPAAETKKRLLILFPDEWLAYSPTVLRLIPLLQRKFIVSVIAFSNGEFQEVARENITYIRIPRPIWRALKRSGLLGVTKLTLLILFSLRRPCSVPVGVDAIGLLACQIRYGAGHLISLEAVRGSAFGFCDAAKVSSVLIQSEDRFRYLFDDVEPPVVYAQNAPTYRCLKRERRNGRAIYLGNALEEHGAYALLDWIKCFPDQCLSIKGVISDDFRVRASALCADALESGRLTLDTEYVEEEDLVGFLSSYSIGFCLYDLQMIPEHDFNYQTCPSGKLFQYYAAGVPVVASKLRGLASLEEFSAGIFVTQLTAADIQKAVEDVLGKWDFFSDNCVRAARHFSFEERAQMFPLPC